MSGKYKLGLEFDVESMYRDLTRFLNFQVKMTVNSMVDQLNSLEFEYAKGTFRQKLEQEGTDMIRFLIGSDHWYAYIIEYGKGTQMDIMNPDLGAYMSSSMYNPFRVGGDIRSWGRGRYTVPDWEGGHGYIEREGYGAPGLLLPVAGKKDREEYHSLPPRRLFRDTFERAKERLKEDLKTTFLQFPFSSYLRGGG